MSTTQMSEGLFESVTVLTLALLQPSAPPTPVCRMAPKGDSSWGLTVSMSTSETVLMQMSIALHCAATWADACPMHHMLIMASKSSPTGERSMTIGSLPRVACAIASSSSSSDLQGRRA